MVHNIIGKLRRLFAGPARVRRTRILLAVGLFALLGLVLLRLTNAATFSVMLEPEDPAALRTANATVQAQNGASGGQAVRFAAGGGGGGGPTSTEAPNLTTTVLVDGLNRPWDLDFLPGGEIIFTQRSGSFSIYENGQTAGISGISGIKPGGEGGLMGVTVDPDFGTNRYIYACHNHSSGDIRVVRGKLAADKRSLTDLTAIVTGIAAFPTGWHAGCRMDFGPDGYLWIGTGDGAGGGNAQDKRGLAGKVLRVNRDGQGAPDNLGGDADPRVFNYGHRNIQGIAFFPSPKNGVLGLTAEHGPEFSDEVNELRKGNFGWGPPSGGYDQTVPMTDKNRFPDAISALWTSGTSSTQAPSGMAILTGSQWKGWDGAAAIAFQKASHVKVLRLDASNKVTQEERVLTNFGRLRTSHLGPDGNLYITTDNAGGDKIIKVVPN